MRNLGTNLPLQDMIRGVIANAQEKLAAENKTTQLLDHREQVVKTAAASATPSLTDPVYIEKLASTLEYLSENIHTMEPVAPRGVLGAALDKLAGGAGVGPAVHTPGGSVLAASKSIGGTQSYKKDKPKTEDAAASQAKTPLSAGGKASHTQVENNMHAAPGQESGSVPTAEYPARGPLVNLGKHASVADFYKAVMGGELEVPIDEGEKQAGAADLGRAALKGVPGGAMLGAAGGLAGSEKGHRLGATAKGAVGGAAMGAGAMALSHHMNAGMLPKLASPAEAAKALILQKLAGEDVMKANITAGRGANPLAGKGQLQSFDATQPHSSGAGGPTSGFGNQGRSHIQSNKGAIDMTKGEAKGPQKEQLKQVLTEPALSPKTDTVLQNNLRNTGKAGVKIAAAATKAFLEKIASEGCTCGGQGACQYDQMNATLAKMAMGGMGGAGGPTPPNPMGQGQGTVQAEGDQGISECTCDHSGQCESCAGGGCKVCNLKAILGAQGPAAGQMAGAPAGGGQDPGGAAAMAAGMGH